MSWSIHGLRNISFYRMQKVTREPDIRAASVPPPDLRWPDIPLDVYRLIIEESSRETLYNFCLVSRISREFAIPVLYRNVELMLVETSGTAFAQCLRHLIKANAAKYCEDLRIGISKDFYAEEFDEPPEYELPMEATVMCLVELALEKMPKLKSFRWDSMKLPNDNFLNALKDRPLLTRLRLGNGGWVDRREEIFRVGVFSHLTSLRLKEIASPELVLEIRRAIDNCAALRFLHLTFVDNWAELEEEIQLFDVLFAPYPGDQRKGKKPPGHSLKRLTMHGLWGDMQLGDSFSSIMTTSFSNLDCLTLHNVEEPLLEELGSCESIRVRKFRLRSSSWEPVESILSNSKLELLHIELFRVGYHYDRLVPLICKSGEKLKELRLEWDQGNIGTSSKTKREVLTHDVATNLITKCYRLQHLSLRADFEDDVWESLLHVFAVWCVDLVSFKLQRAAVPPPPTPASNTNAAAAPAATAPSATRQSPRPLPLVGRKDSPTAKSKEAEPEKRPVWRDAQDFASSFVKAAETSAELDGNLNPTISINLKYVAFDNNFCEVWKRGDEYVFSEMSTGEVEDVEEGVFNKDRLSRKVKYESVFRLSRMD